MRKTLKKMDELRFLKIILKYNKFKYKRNKDKVREIKLKFYSGSALHCLRPLSSSS